MIRRDIPLADGSAGWMLISQIEHARISAEVAKYCIGGLCDASQRAGESPPPAPIRDVVLNAIRHHDDGWADWEQSPQLDRNDGRPLSFTEISHTSAIEIWSRSINAVARSGPLASWMVAGHFLRLSRSFATSAAAADLIQWQTEVEARRHEWFAAWQQVDAGRHSLALADEALQWLWTFDEVSLWLCCTCTAMEPIPCAPEPYRAGRGTPIEMELDAIGADAATARPWRFAEATLKLTISGQVVPAACYRGPAELLAAERPQSLSWRLAQG